MRVAQHWSLCRDDALDAYQRALEIYVRRIDSLDPATEIAWLRVVVKHEALAVRRSRSQLVPVEEVELDGRPRRGAAPGRRAARGPRTGRALGRGAAPHQARRGEGADAQGRGTLVRRDRRVARLDLHEGEPLHNGGSRAVPEGLRGDRGRRGVRAVRADARGAGGRDGERGCAARVASAHPQLRDLPRDGAKAARDAPRPPERAVADPRAAGAAAPGRRGRGEPQAARRGRLRARGRRHAARRRTPWRGRGCDRRLHRDRQRDDVLRQRRGSIRWVGSRTSSPPCASTSRPIDASSAPFASGAPPTPPRRARPWRSRRRCPRRRRRRPSRRRSQPPGRSRRRSRLPRPPRRRSTSRSRRRRRRPRRPRRHRRPPALRHRRRRAGQGSSTDHEQRAHMEATDAWSYRSEMLLGGLGSWRS